MAKKFDLEKRLDEATVEIIRGLDNLLLRAEAGNFFTIATILKEAKEDIAWWAAYQNYEELPSEKLVRQLTVEDALNIAMKFLTKFTMAKNGATKDEFPQTTEILAIKELVRV